MTREVSEAYCSCQAGAMGMCKHTYSLYLTVNSERLESKTDQEQMWQKPSAANLTLYPKGESVLSTKIEMYITREMEMEGCRLHRHRHGARPVNQRRRRAPLAELGIASSWRNQLQMQNLLVHDSLTYKFR